MRRFPIILATSVAVVLLVVAGCSSSSDTKSSSKDEPSSAAENDKGATDAGGSGTPSGSTDDSGGSSAVGCDRVSAADISTTLGLNVGDAEVTRNGPVTVCTYPSAGEGTSQVIVRFQTGMSSSDLASSRAQFESTDQPTVDVTGLGDAAFSSTIGSGSIQTNTIETIQGGTDLLVTAGAPLTGIETLARHVLESL
jgi:hypothetical protein